MGGYGSGRQWHYSTKSTAEDCYVLDVNWMTREGVFDDGGQRSGSIRWSNAYTGQETSSIGYEVNSRERWIRLHYRRVRDDERLDYKFPLTTTDLPWGGVRWWFVCDLTCNRRHCGRRVGKLYLPPGSKYFGCRHCHDLTYESCQESHRYDKILNMSPAEIRAVGFDPRDVLADQRVEKRFKRQVARNEQRRRRRKALNWS